MHLRRGQQQRRRVGPTVGHHRQLGNVRPRIQHAVECLRHGVAVRRAVKVMLAEKRRRSRPLRRVPQHTDHRSVGAPLNVQGVHAPLL